jgi:hypothetical protein
MILLVLATLALLAYQRFELEKARQQRDAQSRHELRRAINRSNEAALRRAVEAGEARIHDQFDHREDRRTLASTYHQLGDLLVNTDRLADATWAYERCMRLLRQHLLDESGDVAAQIELAEIFGNLGETSWALGRARDAQAAYREGLTVRQSLVADHPGVPAYQDDLARALHRLRQLSSTAGPGSETDTR